MSMRNIAYFLWSFTFLIGVQTLRGYWWWSALLAGVVLLVFLLLFFMKKVSGKCVLLVFLWFIVGAGSVLWYWARHEEASTHTASEREHYTQYFGTGEIVNFQGNERYIFKDAQGEWIIHRKDAEKPLTIGDKVMIVWSKKEVYHQDKRWWFPFYRTQNSWDYWEKQPELPALLAWKFDYNMWLYMKGYQGIIEAKNLVFREQNWAWEVAPWAQTWDSWKQDNWEPWAWEKSRWAYWEQSISNKPSFSKKWKTIWSTLSATISHTVSQTRQWMFDKIEDVFGDNKQAGLLRGLLLGERSKIPKTYYQTFIDSWLVHIVAVSGGNMIMLALLLHVLLFFLPYYIRLAVVLCGLIFYGLLCGLDSSVLRALLMWWLMMFALFGGRVVSIRRLMSYAWITMLAFNPYVLLYDMGFLLSFGALAGIVLFQKISASRWAQWRFLPKQLLQKYLLPTLGANLWVLPVLIRFTGTMNMTSFLGNIIVIPFIPVMMLGGLVSALFGPWMSWLQVVFVETWLLKAVYSIASRSARVGWYLQVESMRVRFVVVLMILVMYGVMGAMRKWVNE